MWSIICICYFIEQSISLIKNICSTSNSTFNVTKKLTKWKKSRVEIEVVNWPATVRNITLPLDRVVRLEGRLLAMSPAVNTNFMLRKLQVPQDRNGGRLNQWYGRHDFPSLVSTALVDVHRIDDNMFYLNRFVKAYFEGRNPDQPMLALRGFPMGSPVPIANQTAITAVNFFSIVLYFLIYIAPFTLVTHFLMCGCVQIKKNITFWLTHIVENLIMTILSFRTAQ